MAYEQVRVKPSRLRCLWLQVVWSFKFLFAEVVGLATASIARPLTTGRTFHTSSIEIYTTVNELVMDIGSRASNVKLDTCLLYTSRCV